MKLTELGETCRNHNFSDIIVVHEHRGQPGGWFGSIASFGDSCFWIRLHIPFWELQRWARWRGWRMANLDYSLSLCHNAVFSQNILKGMLCLTSIVWWDCEVASLCFHLSTIALSAFFVCSWLVCLLFSWFCMFIVLWLPTITLSLLLSFDVHFYCYVAVKVDGTSTPHWK